MPTETNVDTKSAFDQLKAQGAVSTEVVLIQNSDTNPYDCTLVARGVLANGEKRDIVMCPSPCKIGQAFNLNK